MNTEFEAELDHVEDEEQDGQQDEALGEESDISVSLIMDGSDEYELSDNDYEQSEDDDYYDTDSDYDGDFDESGGDSGF